MRMRRKTKERETEKKDGDMDGCESESLGAKIKT